MSLTNDVSYIDHQPKKRAEARKITSDLIALRRKIGGLPAEAKQGVMYKVKSAKELHIKLREAADELNMPLAGAIVQQSTEQMPVIQGTDRNGKPTTFFLVACVTTVRFMSDDGSYEDFVGSGNGGGNDDKSGGKASTYSWKDAIIKGLCLPDEEMVDTDDGPGTLPTATPVVKLPPPSFKAVLAAIQGSQTKVNLEEAKQLFKARRDWSQSEAEDLQTAFVEKAKVVY